MSEKPESDEFEDEEDDEPVVEDADVDLDQVNKELDLAKKRGQKTGDPPWRRLERLREEKTPPSSPATSKTTKSGSRVSPAAAGNRASLGTAEGTRAGRGRLHPGTPSSHGPLGYIRTPDTIEAVGPGSQGG